MNPTGELPQSVISILIPCKSKWEGKGRAGRAFPFLPPLLPFFPFLSSFLPERKDKIRKEQVYTAFPSFLIWSYLILSYLILSFPLEGKERQGEENKGNGRKGKRREGRAMEGNFPFLFLLYPSLLKGMGRGFLFPFLLSSFLFLPSFPFAVSVLSFPLVSSLSRRGAPALILSLSFGQERKGEEVGRMKGNALPRLAFFPLALRGINIKIALWGSSPGGFISQFC